MRGAPADWDGLAARGNPGWSWADVLPAYKAMENHSLGAGETRGAGGPLGISVTDTRDELTGAIVESAVSYGWEHVADANASDTERIGFTPSTIRAGRRTTSYDAFVRPVLARQAASRRAAGRRAPGARGRPHRRHPGPRRLADLRRPPGHRRQDGRRQGPGYRGNRPPRGDPLRGLRRDPAAARTLRHRPPGGTPQARHRPESRVTERRRAPHRAARRRPPGDGSAATAARPAGSVRRRARQGRRSAGWQPARACWRPAAMTWSASSSRNPGGRAPTSRACSSRWPSTRRART